MTWNLENFRGKSILKNEGKAFTKDLVEGFDFDHWKESIVVNSNGVLEFKTPAAAKAVLQFFKYNQPTLAEFVSEKVNAAIRAATVEYKKRYD